MQQASRLLAIGLLALAQLFAPLVHAHAGGGDSLGGLHLPGLEFLAKADGTSAQPQGHKACLDVIVGLAPGLKDKAPAFPGPDPAPPPGLRPLAGRFAPSPAPPPFLFPPPARPPWLAPSPRAPPGRG